MPIASDLRQEPGAGKPHAGICAGGRRQLLSLPRRIIVFIDCLMVGRFPPPWFTSEILIIRKPVRVDSFEVKHGISWPDNGCLLVVLLHVCRWFRYGFRRGSAGA